MAIAEFTPTSRQPRFLGSSRVSTTGIKGTLSNIPGIVYGLQDAAQAAGIEVSDITLALLNEATPVIGDIAGRGLLFLDDGSSARSRVMNFASSSAPVLKADLVLDGDTTPAAIDARLDQLVAIAEQRGYAIATATAFPSTVDRVAAFARAAASRGIALVPISDIVHPDGT